MPNDYSQDEDKKTYLIKTFSRTKRKDWENYILNAIWQRLTVNPKLKELKLSPYDIQPVTQQYIRRTNKKYALVDLYFPQINFAIECDEPYHNNQKAEDLSRKKTIEEQLSSFSNSPKDNAFDYEEMRRFLRSSTKSPN